MMEEDEWPAVDYHVSVQCWGREPDDKCVLLGVNGVDRFW